MLLNKISWLRLTYHLLLQFVGLYALYFIFSTEQYMLLIPALLIMFFTQFTIYAHYHMVVTHQSWKFNYKLFDHIFSVSGILMGMGSPIPWAIIHRLHHKHTDTEDDPHSPSYYGLFITHFHAWKAPDIINAKVPKKDLLRNLGAELRLVPSKPYKDDNNFVKVAARLADELRPTNNNGVIWANQFDNTANAKGHY